MSNSYETNINGNRRNILGIDESGNYFLDSGQKLIFKPFENSTFIAWKLKEVASLSFTGGEWLLEKENLLAECCNGIKMQKKDSESRSEYERLSHLYRELENLPDSDRVRVKGVAWFDECWETLEGETQENCDARHEFLSNFGDYDPIQPLPHATLFRPVLLLDYGIVKESQIRQAEECEKTLISAANHLSSAAATVKNGIRENTEELRSAVGQLGEVSQPFREMYKDVRLSSAKADALKADIPELVIDVMVAFYHKSKLPTTDSLLKYLNSSNISSQLESAGRGTSRSQVGRWLQAFKKVLSNRGLIQAQRPRNPSATSQAGETLPNQYDQNPPDTRDQELPEGSSPEDS